MTVNPVFLNELRQSAMRRRGTLISIVFVVIVALLSALGQLGDLRNIVVFAPFLLLPLLVPAIASGAFAKEYEQQTWLDLTLTRLTNSQVVWGKFGAYFVQVAAAIVAFAPPLLLILLGDYSRRMSDLRTEVLSMEAQIAAIVTTLAYVLKLIASSGMYIFLTMVCSRYCPNRRAALTWSYVAMGLYTGFGILVWQLIGALDYQIHSSESERRMVSNTTFIPLELTTGGFMENFHLMFCVIVGIGAYILLWVSLSEQRGYKGGASEGGVSRGWQPISKRAVKQVT